MWIIIIYLGPDIASQFVVIGVTIRRDSRSTDIRSRTTSYPHETSEEIINQAHPKYSV